MGFKVTYRTREKLQRAIKQTIVKKGLIQDWAMHDSIRVSAGTGDIGNVTMTVNCIYYYVFLDNGTINIDEQFITEDALNTRLGQEFINDVYQEYINYLKKEFEMLETDNIVLSQIKLLYNIFGGGEHGYPDGIVDLGTRFRVR